MDQFVVDVTGIGGVRQDDEVVVFGRQGEEEISAEEVAALAGTFNYEVVTPIPPVPSPPVAGKSPRCPGQ